MKFPQQKEFFIFEFASQKQKVRANQKAEEEKYTSSVVEKYRSNSESQKRVDGLCRPRADCRCVVFCVAKNTSSSAYPIRSPRRIPRSDSLCIFIMHRHIAQASLFANWCAGDINSKERRIL